MLVNSGLVLYGLKEHFVAHRALPRKLSAVTVEAMCEQLPNPDSRVTLAANARDRNRLVDYLPLLDTRLK